MSRVTITTLAEDLSLSVCTINKALNDKPGVSADTRRRVKETALRLGYRPNRLAQALASPPLSIGVVYPDAWQSHYGLLVDGVRREIDALQDHRLSADYRVVHGFANGAAFVGAVQDLVDAGVNGMIISLGMYDLCFRQQAWKVLAESQIPYVLLGTECVHAAPLTCVWTDGYRSGRVAGELLGWVVREQSVAVLIGSRENLEHQNKIAGLRDELSRCGLTLAGVYETQDEPGLAAPVAQQAFAEHPNLGGLYIATENVGGVGSFLADAGLAGKVHVVATGKSPEVLQLLHDGILQCSLFQNEDQQGEMAVSVLHEWLQSGRRPEREMRVPPVVLLRNTVDLWMGSEVTRADSGRDQEDTAD